MIFNSLTYLLLLVVVVALYWVLPYRARLWLIFSASLVFYGFWRVEFLPVLLLSAGVDFWVARRMPGQSNRRRTGLLLISLGVNLGLLFYFKYLIFFAENAIGLAHLLGIDLDPIALQIILPLGISFYTFQTISYTVDVYRGLIEPEEDFVLYACYVTFFPQLVAGPVLRAAEVIHQFVQRPPFAWDDLAIGMRRVLYGLFLKVVLADNLAPLVDQGFATPVGTLSALDVWTLAFLFGFQIYFDFSAYSHIALGSARMMAIRFPENFNFPYLASSPREFWRRWHISLSSWIRDYLYLPLAGVRVHDRSVGGLASATTGRPHPRALFLTWGIMGLWHGANWTFLVWGLYHALMITLYRAVEPATRRLGSGLRWWGGLALTLPLMMLAWVPFRAGSLDLTFAMWAKVLEPAAYTWLGLRENLYLIATLVLVGIFVTYAVRTRLGPLIERLPPRLSGIPLLALAGDTTMMAVISALVIVFLRPINQFIYFQF